MKGKFLGALAVCLILVFTTTAAYAREGNVAANCTNQGQYILEKNKANKGNKNYQERNRNQVKKNLDFVAATGITLSKTSVTLAVNSWERLSAAIQPANATDKKFFWFSSNPAVASVNQNGYITGVYEGTATVTVTTVDGSKQDTCIVRVIPVDEWVEATGVNLNLINTTIPVGFIDTLRYEIGPSNATDQDVRWRSSNSAVAAVNAFGRIEAKAVGMAVITATTVDGGETASCLVVVTARVNPPSYGILLNKTASTMLVGEYDYPAVIFYPANENNYYLTWTSSDTGVATVDQNGRVLAKGQGTAVINVKTSNNWSASYIVTVV